MTLTELSIKRPSFIIVIFTILIGGGLISYNQLSYELLPDFSPPILTVTTTYPGASPATVETQVSKPLEDALSGLENISEVTAFSLDNASIVLLEFKASADLDEVLQEAERKINVVQNNLPEGAKAPVVSKIEPNASPVLQVSAVAGNMDERDFMELMDDQILPQIKQTKGVSDVQVIGGEKREFRVNIDKEKLKTEWARKTLEKDDLSAVAKGEWAVVDRATGRVVQGQTYNGYTKDEVRDRAKQKLSPASSDTDFDKSYSVEPQNPGRWEIYSFDADDDRPETEKTLEIVDAPNRGAAADLVDDKYNDQRIAFKVRPYYGDEVAKPEPTPRAKLAKRIIQKPKVSPAGQQATTTEGVPMWEVYEIETGHVVYKFDADTKQEADAQGQLWLAHVGAEQPALFGVRPKMAQPSVRDVEPNVAQNFSTNPRPTAAIDNQVRMPNGVPVWLLFDVEMGTVLKEIPDHTAREAYDQGMTWLRGIGAEDPDTYGERFAIKPKMQS
jgi:hypothetical protein